MGSPKRKEGEPWALFKIRRKIENALDKVKLKPRVRIGGGKKK
jgi:hypothetical protein